MSTDWGYGIAPYDRVPYGEAWSSYWQATFTKPVVRQLLAIIYRDIQAALDNVAGTRGAYPSPTEYDLAWLPVQQFPAILVVPFSDEFDIENQNFRGQTIRLFVSVAVTHQNRNILAELLQDYVRALDQVIESAWNATSMDFSANDLPLPCPPFPAGSLSPGLPVGSLCKIWIESHAYDEMRRHPQSGFVMSATIGLLVERTES